MPRPQPSIKSILQADYGAMLCALGPLVFWGIAMGMAVVNSLDGKAQDLTMVVIASVGTAVCGPFLVIRLRSIFAIFRDGVEVDGVVTSVEFYRDRGTVEFTFPWEGEVWSVSRAIHKTDRTTALKKTQAVVVLVDPTNPKNAHLRDLFV